MRRRLRRAGFGALVVLALASIAAPRVARAEMPQVVTEDPAIFPVRIDAIRITGLVRTKSFVVRRELGFREGDVVTKEDFDLAITRLWNTTLFARVHGHVLREDGIHVIVFEVEDRWTLNPLLSFGSGGGASYFRVGATDNNVAGRFLELYALYENFDGSDGGLLFARDPRAFGGRNDLSVQVDRLIRPRPGFLDQRTQAAIELAQLKDRDRLRVGVRVSAFADRFLEPLGSTPVLPQPTETFLLEPRLRLGRIDTERVRQRGVTFDVRPGVGFTTSDVASEYVSLAGEVLAFATAGARWNFAARARAATLSRAPPHLQMFAGGLDLIRGFPDNYVRTRVLALTNLEVRFVAFDSMWIALLPTVFVDALAARSPEGVTGTAMSAGGGVRVIVPKFVASGLRADVAVPLHDSLRAVSTDEVARFGPPTPVPQLGSLQLSLGVYQFF